MLSEGLIFGRENIAYAVLALYSDAVNEKPVVILIDEYDKPILDNITDVPMRSYARDVLKGLYEHIKYNDEWSIYWRKYGGLYHR